MITSTEQISHEKIYFEDNSIYISNTKIKFNGVIEDNLNQEEKDYVIQSENLVSAYKEDVDFKLEFAIFFVMYAWSISNLSKESKSDYGISFGAFLFFLSVIIATIFFIKYNFKKFKKWNKPLRIVGRQNGVSIIYQINIKSQLNLSELEILYENIISNLIKVIHDRDLKIKFDKDSEIRKENLQKLLILKDEFSKNFVILNNVIDIPSIDTFSKHLESHQHEIAKFDQGWIHNLVKIKSYLQSANNSIKSNFQQTIEEEDLEYFKQMQAEVIKQVEAYDKVYGNALILIDSIIESNHVLSYEIYEIFDKLGFFESNWEQRLIQKFDNLTDSIDETNANINTINEKFDLITNASISKMKKETDSPNLLQTGMPLLSLYGGYKLGYHLFGPSKKKF